MGYVINNTIYEKDVETLFACKFLRSRYYDFTDKETFFVLLRCCGTIL